MPQQENGSQPESLASALQIIEQRIEELTPLVEEHRKLVSARQALATGEAPKRRGPGRPRKNPDQAVVAA